MKARRGLTGRSCRSRDCAKPYDRIRENLVKHRETSLARIINLSISETLGRTIITSGVTALSLVALSWWGTGVLRDFAFTLLVGMWRPACSRRFASPLR